MVIRVKTAKEIDTWSWMCEHNLLVILLVLLLLTCCRCCCCCFCYIRRAIFFFIWFYSLFRDTQHIRFYMNLKTQSHKCMHTLNHTHSHTNGFEVRAKFHFFVDSNSNNNNNYKVCVSVCWSVGTQFIYLGFIPPFPKCIHFIRFPLKCRCEIVRCTQV